MSRMLLAQDLQPTLPLAGNEELYSKATGIPLEVIKKIIPKHIKELEAGNEAVI